MSVALIQATHTASQDDSATPADAGQIDASAMWTTSDSTDSDRLNGGAIFENVGTYVTEGATITQVVMQVNFSSTKNDSPHIHFRAEESVSPADFSASDGPTDRILNSTMTTASVEWGRLADQGTGWHDSADIKTVVQEWYDDLTITATSDLMITLEGDESDPAEPQTTINGAGSASAPILEITFTNDYYFDDFNRTDENLDNSDNWTMDVGVSTGLRVQTNEVECNGAGSGQYAHWDDGVGNQDMSARMEITGIQLNTQLGPMVRMDPAGTAGDGFMMMVDGYSSYVGLLRRSDGTSRTTIGTTTAGVNNGDYLYVEAIGSSIEGQIEGKETETATDTAHDAAAHDHGGIFGYDGGTNVTGDNWSCQAEGTSSQTVTMPVLEPATLTAPQVNQTVPMAILSPVSLAAPQVNQTVPMAPLEPATLTAPQINQTVPMSVLAPATLTNPTVTESTLTVSMPVLSPTTLAAPQINQTVPMPVLAPASLVLPTITNDATTVSMPVLSPASLAAPQINQTIPLGTLAPAALALPTVSNDLGQSVTMLVLSPAVLTAPDVIVGPVGIEFAALSPATLTLFGIAQGASILPSTSVLTVELVDGEYRVSLVDATHGVVLVTGSE